MRGRQRHDDSPAWAAVDDLSDCFGQHWPGILIISCLTLLAYSSVFPAGFIWDDDAYVINNMQLRTVAGLSSIWLDPGATPQYYPMVFTLFWVQFHLWGLNPFGYHLVNILFHVANSLLLWNCLQRIKLPAAFWVAALFAVHPVQVESVAWVTELKNVLSLFFYLLSLLAYLRFSGIDGENPPALRGRLYYAASLLLFLLALFSKTVSGSLPAAILLLRWWQTGRIGKRDVVSLLPFFALALVFGSVTAGLEVRHVLASGPEWDFSFVDRMLIAGRAVWFYAAKLLWPHPLIFNYPRWTIDAGAWWQYLYPVALVSLLTALWRLRERLGRGPLAAALFFVGTLFPALGFFNVYPMRYSFVADHFQYAASIGLVAILVVCVESLMARRGLTPVARGLVFGLLAVMAAALTWSQGHVYRDRFALFSDTIDKNPASWLSYSNRGRDYLLEGREDLAMADLERALQANPDDADALQCRSIIWMRRKDYDRALADLDRSVALQPSRADYFLNRSVARRTAGLQEPALADADMSIRLDPYNARAYLERSALYAMLDNNDKALEDLDLALELDPENSQALSNRGLIYYRAGRQREAIGDFSRALLINPDSAATLFNRGLAEAASGAISAAGADLARARQLGYPISEADMRNLLQAKGKR